MVLIVRESDDYGRIACSLQNIELFEFGNMEKRVIDDIKYIKSVEDFSKSLKKASLPITEDGKEELQQRVYDVIEGLLENHGLSEKWNNLKNKDLGEWFDHFKYLFLNKFILSDEKVVMGIFEDILWDKNMPVCVAYYADLYDNDEIIKTKRELDKLERSLKVKQNLAKRFKKEISINEENHFEYSFVQKYNSTTFFRNVEKIMEFNISNYPKVFRI